MTFLNKPSVVVPAAYPRYKQHPGTPSSTAAPAGSSSRPLVQQARSSSTMSTAWGERLQMLHESRTPLYDLPCDVLFELPGRPNVMYAIKDYRADKVAGAQECRSDMSFLFKAFETGQIGPRRLSRMVGENKPRNATIHEYLDWTVTGKEAQSEGDYVSVLSSGGGLGDLLLCTTSRSIASRHAAGRRRLRLYCMCARTAIAAVGTAVLKCKLAPLAGHTNVCGNSRLTLRLRMSAQVVHGHHGSRHAAQPPPAPHPTAARSDCVRLSPTARAVSKSRAVCTAARPCRALLVSTPHYSSPAVGPERWLAAHDHPAA